jgi:hypothetical protein
MPLKVRYVLCEGIHSTAKYGRGDTPLHSLPCCQDALGHPEPRMLGVWVDDQWDLMIQARILRQEYCQGRRTAGVHVCKPSQRGTSILSQGPKHLLWHQEGIPVKESSLGFIHKIF